MTRAQARLRSRTLELLKERGPQSRAELARCLLVSRSTMSSLIASMVAERIVEDVGDGPTRARTTGRPGARVALKAPDGYFVGIDFGRLRINVAVSDANYQIVEQLSRDFDIDVAAQTALDLAAGSVKTLLGRAGVDRREINAIGIGVPGPVDASTGMLHAGSILASWIGTDVPGGLSRRLGLPAYMDNDANLGALAESVYGSAVGARVALYVLLSADFVAVTQLLVYVGGVMVLVLFAVMLTSKITEVNVSNRSFGLFGGALLFVAMAPVLVAVAMAAPWRAVEPGPLAATTEAIGDALLTRWLLPFEVASLVLLATLIGAVVIARKELKAD